MATKSTMVVGGVPEQVNFPWHFGMEHGLFSASGIDLKWIDYGTGTGAMVDDLRDKKIDIAVLVTEGAVRAIAEGLKARVVSFFVKSPLVWGIYTKPGFSGTLDDLKGTKYAISRTGSGSHLMTFIDAQRRGWPTSLRFSIVGDIHGAIRSINNDETQLFFWEKSTTKPFVDKGLLQLVGECSTDWPGFVIVVHDDILKRRAGEVKAVLDALHEVIKRVQGLKDLSSVLSKRYGLSSSNIAAWLKTAQWSTTSGLHAGSLAPVVEVLHNLKIIKNKPQESDLTWNGE